jgi:cardiolipin synthase A/B
MLLTSARRRSRAGRGNTHLASNDVTCRRLYRTILVAVAAVLLASGAAACRIAPPHHAAGQHGRRADSRHARRHQHHSRKRHQIRHAAKRHSHHARPVHHASHSQHASHPPALKALAEPGAGLGPVYHVITSAHRSIELTMYELRDAKAEADLAAAARRGVDVRVILDQHLERSRNAAAFGYLKAHHVHVAWAPAGTTYHQKTLTADGSVSVVMSLNLVAADYGGTRDFAVIDKNHHDIAAIVATFQADFAHRSIDPPHGADLVWSPTNSLPSILAIIGGAHHTLSVENEEMADTPVIDALMAAARRGVDVKIVMTADSEWDHALSELTRAGAHVRLFPDSDSALYIHAKAIVADAGRSDQRVFVGSENFSEASLDYNRELGIMTTQKAVISVIATTLARDYADAPDRVAA